MGRIARRVLSGLAVPLWLAAIGLIVFRQSDRGHAADGYLMGYAMMLGLMALAGTLCGALRDTQRDPVDLLLQALLVTPPTDEESHSRRLRAVDAPEASRPATHAAGE